MKPADMLVALMLAEHADSEGGHAFPSVKRLADETRLHRATVIRSLASLVELGIVEVEQRATNRVPAMYRFPAFETAQTSQNATPKATAQTSQIATRESSRRRNLSSLTSHSATLTIIEPSSVVTDVTTRDARARESVADDCVEFERDLWKAYPRQNRGPKDRALAAWRKLDLDAQRRAVIYLPRWIACDQWQRGLVNRCDRWLAGEMFDEQPPAATKLNGKLDETHAVKRSLDYLDEQAAASWATSSAPVVTSIGYDDDGALDVEWEQR
jgi:DNA-binding transcriptional regulator YhcF (GntR family)